MKKTAKEFMKVTASGLSAVLLSLIAILGVSAEARADEADVERLLKAMSEYVGAQQALSFQYDAILEIVTKDDQILSLANSGSVTLSRPDKLHATRSGGFADVATFFDGKTLTMLGKNQNAYVQIDVPGTIDHLIDELMNKYNRPLPAADLLLSDSFDALMLDVVDIKDLGSGVIGGIECNHFAFRTKEVDWQIWIAQGERPYPCRYSISSKVLARAPQYTIQFENWKTGGQVRTVDYGFRNPTGAQKVELTSLEGNGGLPDNFTMGENQ